MKYFLIVFFLIFSTHSFSNDRDDINVKRIIDRASYENCKIYIKNGKIESRNCSTKKKKNNVQSEIKKESERVINRNVDKALKKIFG